MNIQTTKFLHRPLYVDAIRVTAENMGEVAKWCQGEVRTHTTRATGTNSTHIKVRVHRPTNDRQTKAFVGDWVLYTGISYKVYTDKAFEKYFVEAQEDGYEEVFDENTLNNVFGSLLQAGLDGEQSREAITKMQNSGILFRERTGDTQPQDDYNYFGAVVDSETPIFALTAEAARARL